ncbi:MAG TPA: TonB family protein [Bacteroidia bacterium]|nr:TonB family protein [Bacteroidota bacterium]HRC32739.1 TonB family protein [Bacteroidia bacterium]
MKINILPTILYSILIFGCAFAKMPKQNFLFIYKLEHYRQVSIIAEQMPEFVGGVDSLKSFMKNNFSYSNAARANKVQGVIYIGFVVEADGTLSNIKILRGIKNDYGLNAEAIRVVEIMPKWIPGKAAGKNVSINFVLPFQCKS